MFSRAEALEFTHRDHVGAIAELRRLTTHGPPEVRAQAIAGIARNYLKRNRPRQALEAFEQLYAAGAATVGGMPAALAAHVGALAVYERQQDRAGLERTARALERDLNSGRWAVTRQPSATSRPGSHHGPRHGQCGREPSRGLRSRGLFLARPTTHSNRGHWPFWTSTVAPNQTAVRQRCRAWRSPTFRRRSPSCASRNYGPSASRLHQTDRRFCSVRRPTASPSCARSTTCSPC